MYVNLEKMRNRTRYHTNWDQWHTIALHITRNWLGDTIVTSDDKVRVNNKSNTPRNLRKKHVLRRMYPWIRAAFASISMMDRNLDRASVTPRYVAIWLGWWETPCSSNVTTTGSADASMFSIKISEMSCGDHTSSMPSRKLGWSMIYTLSRGIPNTDALEINSLLRWVPNPSLLPVDIHMIVVLQDCFWHARRKGPKNIASSSGWAMTRKTFLLEISNGFVEQSCDILGLKWSSRKSRSNRFLQIFKCHGSQLKRYKCGPNRMTDRPFFSWFDIKLCSYVIVIVTIGVRVKNESKKLARSLDAHNKLGTPGFQKTYLLRNQLSFFTIILWYTCLQRWWMYDNTDLRRSLHISITEKFPEIQVPQCKTDWVIISYHVHAIQSRC